MYSSHIRTIMEDTSTKLTVESTGNHIYFYSRVDEDRCLALLKEIRDLDASLRSEYITRELPDNYPPTPIWLHIQSLGGGLWSALGLSDQLAHISSPIFSIVEGCVASAATLISISCSRRFITPSSFMLIHQISGESWGKYQDLKDEMRLHDMEMEQLIAFYTRYSKMSHEQITSALHRESWFCAAECLSLGLVDEIR